MGLPNPGMILEPGRTALVLTDLQNDFLNPGGNGWALFGLAQALRAQNKTDEAALVDSQFAQAWKDADVKLTASVL